MLNVAYRCDHPDCDTEEWVLVSWNHVVNGRRIVNFRPDFWRVKPNGTATTALCPDHSDHGGIP